MKILQLTAENVKKLKVVDITPATDVVQITGKNGSGKTSVLDSIWWALGGTKEIQAMPIRKGQESARIKLDLGEIVVTRKFTDKGSTLTVENAEGARFPSPQKMLDDLIGELSFDPLAFATMDCGRQYTELKRIAKIEVDLDALDTQNKLDYETRTLRNREEKEYRTRAEGFEFKFEALEQPIDVDALVTELSNAAQRNADIDTRAQRRLDAAELIRIKGEEVVALEAKIAVYRKEMAELQDKLDTAEPLAEKIVVDDLRTKIADAQARNAEFAVRAKKAKLLEQAKTAEAASDALTAKMAERTKTKEDAIAAAKMPIDGLSLSDGQVLLNGIPFDQSSSAEQLRTSVAIAMAANPKLKVIRIKDGSLLDEDGLAIIEGLAKGNGYQVWIESVNTSGKIGIYMEDGAVAHVNEAA
ncbi:AAA family ATPase [Limnoglobus roseus]|uniref:DNA replication and repair protein RecF n=1 Tax=Limnoglobus roseus TaxID=2598579 RepID=A0A5C1A7Q2_9BACT|nr:AAA family ATPase [Limnoglobus roseus]QEL14760.1 DNA replication and repair protein RecF [Limnoglobus roseus]